MSPQIDDEGTYLYDNDFTQELTQHFVSDDVCIGIKHKSEEQNNETENNE